MEIFDNVARVVKDDLAATIDRGCRVSIAAACFSIYLPGAQRAAR